ncbi:hypothetical protein Raf01_44270 [Rugosimonospora africana]|uniref:Uncharacterized protein n=2 Tax=Rugosimonospora africana TaxID=556532 RepID=A0A8J3VRJ1_9ACTN|nr:hypothetical protein Raf01_44270 [Rugosimonospora africana]
MLTRVPLAGGGIGTATVANVDPSGANRNAVRNAGNFDLHATEVVAVGALPPRHEVQELKRRTGGSLRNASDGQVNVRLTDARQIGSAPRVRLRLADGEHAAAYVEVGAGAEQRVRLPVSVGPMPLETVRVNVSETMVPLGMSPPS